MEYSSCVVGSSLCTFALSGSALSLGSPKSRVPDPNKLTCSPIYTQVRADETDSSVLSFLHVPFLGHNLISKFYSSASFLIIALHSLTVVWFVLLAVPGVVLMPPVSP